MMSDRTSRRQPSTTAHRDVLQVRVGPGGPRGTGVPSSERGPGDLLADAWSCVETFAGPDAVLLGAGGPAPFDAGALVADGLSAASRDAGVVVLVTRGRPSAFAAAAEEGRLRVVVVDDTEEGPAGLQPWTDSLDGHAVVVSERGQLAGAVCEALAHEGPALVHVRA